MIYVPTLHTVSGLEFNAGEMLLSNFDALQRMFKEAEFMMVKPSMINNRERNNLKSVSRHITDELLNRTDLEVLEPTNFHNPCAAMRTLYKYTLTALPDPSWVVKQTDFSFVSIIMLQLFDVNSAGIEFNVTYSETAEYHLNGTITEREDLDVYFEVKHGSHITDLYNDIKNTYDLKPWAFKDFCYRYKNTAERPVDKISFTMGLNDPLRGTYNDFGVTDAVFKALKSFKLNT